MPHSPGQNRSPWYASLDCKKSHGATDDISNRGDKSLNPVFTNTIKLMFDQKFGAVIALELAKKRGE